MKKVGKYIAAGSGPATHTYGCNLQFELLMMGVKVPETYKANIVK
jgi:hypothetical protein